MVKRVNRITGKPMDSVEDFVLSIPINCMSQVDSDGDRFSDIAKLESEIDDFIPLLISTAEIHDSSGFVRNVSLLRNNLPEYRERLYQRGSEYVASTWAEHGKRWYDTKDDFFEATVHVKAAQQLELKSHHLIHIVDKLKSEGFEAMWANWAELSAKDEPIQIIGSEYAYICPVCRTIGDFDSVKACKHVVACPSCVFLHPKGGKCVDLREHHRELRHKLYEERVERIVNRLDDIYQDTDLDRIRKQLGILEDKDGT